MLKKKDETTITVKIEVCLKRLRFEFIFGQILCQSSSTERSKVHQDYCRSLVWSKKSVPPVTFRYLCFWWNFPAENTDSL